MRVQISRDKVIEFCPEGFLWFSCATNSFTGCCSINPCAEGVTCPDINQPFSSTTKSTCTPAPTSLSTVSFHPIMSSSVATPTVVISVGAPVSASPSSTGGSEHSGHASSSHTGIVSHHAPTGITTVYVVPQATTDVTMASIPLPTISSPLLTPSATPAAVNGNNAGGSNTANSFPTGIIIAVVVCFTILGLAIGVMGCLFWRNKHINCVGNDEATEMRSRRSNKRAYYMPQPPTPEAQQMLGAGGCGGCGGGGGNGPEESPVRNVRPAGAPPEVVTPRRVVATSSPRRVAAPSTPGSVGTGMPWPPVSLATVYGASGSPFQDASVNGGCAVNHPDPLRANEPNMTSGYHNWPLNPSRADPVVSPGHDAVFSPRTNAEPRNIDSTSYNNLNYGSSQFNSSLLSRVGSLTQSTHHPLSPPPRRRPKSEAYSTEAAAAVAGTVTKGSEGRRIGGRPGLRLSGCGGDMREGFLQGEEQAIKSERATWYGEGHVDPPESAETPRRRFSQ